MLATIFLLLGLIIGCVVGFFGYEPMQRRLCEHNEDASLRVAVPVIPDTPVVNAAKVDTIPVINPDTVPAPAPVYDTVTETKFLATIARRHYGITDYWVYIYLANRDKLPHRVAAIAPGTRVLIPDTSTFALPGGREATKKRARQLADSLSRHM